MSEVDESVHSIISKVRGTDWKRVEFEIALADLGPQAVPALMDWLYADDYTITSTVAAALARIGGVQVLAALEKTLRAKDASPRASSAWALSQTSSGSKVLFKALHDENPEVRISVLAYSGKFGKHDARFATRIGELLCDKSVGVQAAAAQALEACDDNARQFIPRLAEMLLSQNAHVRLYAGNTLKVICLKEDVRTLKQLALEKEYAPRRRKLQEIIQKVEKRNRPKGLSDIHRFGVREEQQYKRDERRRFERTAFNPRASFTNRVDLARRVV